MSTLVLPKETGRTLVELTGEPRLEVALTLVIRDYARHKTETIDAAILRYEAKYKMPFDEYKRLWETVDQEEDYLVVKAIIENLYNRNEKYLKIEEVKSFLDTHPEIYSLNVDIVRNEGLLNSLREDKTVKAKLKTYQ